MEKKTLPVYESPKIATYTCEEVLELLVSCAGRLCDGR